MDKSKDAKLKRNARIEAESLGRMLTRVIEKHPCGARKVKVNFIGLDGPTDALGYTIPGRDGRADVYINYGTHDTTGLFDYVAKKEGEERKDSAFQFMRMGVAAHEDCHQLMTAFNYERRVLAKYHTKSEQAVRHQFFNILEDPAIEYFSPSYFGGLMQRSLRYVIKNTYDWSPELSESDSAYTQYMNALIQFGDMGCPKGKFTFPEAEDMFMKTASLFNEGVECPDARKRVDIAMEIADIAEPLWRPEVERNEEIKRLLEDIWETFKDLGLRGDGDISEEPADPSSPAVKVAVRRKKAAKAAADKAEKAESEAGEGSGSGESDDGESETDGGSGEGESDDSASDDGEGSGEGSGESDSSEGSGEGSAKSDAEDPDKSDGGKSKGGSGTASMPGDPEASDAEVEDTDDDPADGDADEDFDADDDSGLTDDDASGMSEMMSDEEAREAKEAKADGESDIAKGDFEGFPSDKGRYKGVTALDFYGGDEARKAGLTPEYLKAMYTEIVNGNSWSIHKLIKELDRIFESCKEEKKMATSGTYNVKRGAIGTTAKVFDRRRAPADKKDAAVMLLVDQSGSMGSIKMDAAKKTAIILSEALTKLKVPYYVMGFSADEQGSGGGSWSGGLNDVHVHYVDWTDRPSDRYTIAGMYKRCNNSDGMSIAYASSLLEKRTERNRILIVISDGIPDAHLYDRRNGLKDTALSIREARNKGVRVFGILIGREDAGDHVMMYGSDFLKVSTLESLASSLSKKLVKLIDRD